MSNRNSLIAISDAAIQDSPPNNITAENVRALHNDIINSASVLINDNTYTEPNNFNDIVTCKSFVNAGLSTLQLANGDDISSLTKCSIVTFGTELTYFQPSDTGVKHFIVAYEYFDPSGTIRFVNKDDSQSAPEWFILPNGKDIIPQAGDSFDMVHTPQGWRIYNYKKFANIDIGQNLIWRKFYTEPSINTAEPYILKAQGFRGYRGIYFSGTGRINEYALDYPETSLDQGQYKPMSGTFGLTGSGCDIEVDIVGNNYTLDNMRFLRFARHIRVFGYITLSNANGQSLWLFQFAAGGVSGDAAQYLDIQFNVRGYGIAQTTASSSVYFYEGDKISIVIGNQSSPTITVAVDFIMDYKLINI